MKTINALSLFDGMACGRLALERAGFKINRYFASEVDKFAIKVANSNYPDIVQLGDVREVSAYNLPKIDLLLGGSPCQGFSFAGKRLNFEDPRSKLFFEFVRIWNEVKEINPESEFLLENVNMRRRDLGIISNYIGVYPVNINSNLVSAQNRNRWYWTNIRTKTDWLGYVYSDIPQPKGRGVLLKDVLEIEVGEKYFLSDKKKTYITSKGRIEKSHTAIDGDKALPIPANYFKSGNGAFCIDCNGRTDKEKSSPITSDYAKGAEKYGSRPFTGMSIEGKSRTLRSGGSSSKNDKHNCDIISTKNDIRRLTPVECERLQTVPDNYTNYVSESQRYKMLGNGWTIGVISHILKFISKSQIKSYERF